ncbi:MAG: hypothetical protein HY931_03895 [Candidatus Falkowbacteria bacterium]|nr:MAG: hypothetical protein HY931_03895 [Candidatus Falkowbacteria bacterium]
MKIDAKKVILAFILLVIVIFVFVVGVILSGRYILTTKNLAQNNNASLPENSAANLFPESGLPAEAISNDDSEFLAFINTSAKDGDLGYFKKVDETDLILTNINNLVSIAGDGSTTTINFFDISGQPLFFKSDPAYYGEEIEYSPNRDYALEISTSEPDSSASLWDLTNQKVYYLAQCGTACNLRGGYWLNNEQLLVFGIEENYNVNLDKFQEVRFINIYDLVKKIKSVYSDE